MLHADFYVLKYFDLKNAVPPSLIFEDKHVTSHFCYADRLKATFQLRVFHAHVHARKGLDLSKFYTSSNYLNKYKLNYVENYIL